MESAAHHNAFVVPEEKCRPTRTLCSRSLPLLCQINSPSVALGINMRATDLMSANLSGSVSQEATRLVTGGVASKSCAIDLFIYTAMHREIDRRERKLTPLHPFPIAMCMVL
jgi:hypothetical protein